MRNRAIPRQHACVAAEKMWKSSQTCGTRRKMAQSSNSSHSRSLGGRCNDLDAGRCSLAIAAPARMCCLRSKSSPETTAMSNASANFLARMRVGRQQLSPVFLGNDGPCTCGPYLWPGGIAGNNLPSTSPTLPHVRQEELPAPILTADGGLLRVNGGHNRDIPELPDALTLVLEGLAHVV